MAKPFTLEMLEALNLEQRDNLYKNALTKTSPEALAIIDLLLKHHLLVRVGGGLPHHHPIILLIEETVKSARGREMAKAAADLGLPAMAGLDPLLAEAVGKDYGAYDTTSWAGSFAAEIMEELGYKQVGKRPLPAGSVAKTAAFFALK